MKIEMRGEKAVFVGRVRWKKHPDADLAKAYIEADGNLFVLVYRYFDIDGTYLESEWEILEGSGGRVVDEGNQAKDWRQIKKEVLNAYKVQWATKQTEVGRKATVEALRKHLSKDAVDRLVYSALAPRYQGMHFGVLEEIEKAFSKSHTQGGVDILKGRVLL